MYLLMKILFCSFIQVKLEETVYAHRYSCYTLRNRVEVVAVIIEAVTTKHKNFKHAVAQVIHFLIS